MTKERGEGMDRDELQGNLKDPTGLPPPPRAGDRRNGNDQQMPKGAEGREGGSAGSRTSDVADHPPTGKQVREE
ncbi:MAG: hypothetical protein ABJC61_00635 [Acidobacteriota bacterium]